MEQRPECFSNFGWPDYLFYLQKLTDDRDFRPQTCTNGLVFREYKHIKNTLPEHTRSHPVFSRVRVALALVFYVL
jgi:hypothetical protein